MSTMTFQTMKEEKSGQEKKGRGQRQGKLKKRKRDGGWRN